MKKYIIQSEYKKRLADDVTPVSIFQNIRSKFPKSFLLESSDYHGDEDSYSFICFNPVASIKVQHGRIFEIYPDGNHEISSTEEEDVVERLNAFAGSFQSPIDEEFDFISNGLFGFISFEGVQHFDKFNLDQKIKFEKEVPDLQYFVFQNIIAINHFKNELYLFQHNYNPEAPISGMSLEELENLVFTPKVGLDEFETIGEEQTNFTDEEFVEMVQKAKEHCQRGDVFQLVVSREFSQQYIGDDFTLYRALRSINPSPYLFYFDFDDFRIFGSSPEAQIVIKKRKATIYPIAGTFRRTGDDKKDAKLAEKLLDDPKENAEHVMLVDLARNDLSRDARGVEVEAYREVQFYSHVIHLVSKVSGQLLPEKNSVRMVADTFPAGTLSGAPKHMAVKLINRYEKNQRGVYGGCIGYLGFNGDFNHAIIIRSFLSKDNCLFYQAGAGVVNQSVDENERQEVFNKLAALHKAIDLAKEIGK
jgi:anthranilate synthase component 1